LGSGVTGIGIMTYEDVTPLPLKVKPFGFHAICHLTASVLSEAGVPVKYIQAVLRHKKLSTTERYLHRLEDLKSALQVLERKGNLV
jgi:site-specific recombinase XerD